ncbi:MAG: transketolase C-terminal domain-containing protein [Clostridia bacterium]
MEMRKVYTSTLAKLMEKNDKIVILDADLAKACGTNALYKQFPNRCVDIGIAEANMVSIAVGLAHYGYIPFVHSFAPFVARRAFDQIAVGCGYGQMPVVIVGTDPGVCATLNGGTHMCFEDISALRSVPNMLIFEPCDNAQLEQALPQIIERKAPSYLRLMRKEDYNIFPQDYKFDLYTADRLREGKDLTIVVSGFLTKDCITVADKLSSQGISVDLINVHTIKPLDQQTIINSAKKTNRVLVVENASMYGGLFGAVAETLSLAYPTKCAQIAILDRIGQVGQLDELRKDYGLTEQDIFDKAKSLL